MSGRGVPFLLLGTAMLLSTRGIRFMADPGPYDPGTWLYAHRRAVSSAFALFAVASIAVGLFLTFFSE